MQGTQYGCDKERHRDSKIRPGSPWEQDAMAPQLVCVATTKQPRGHRVWTVFSRRPKSLNYQGQGRVVGAIKRFNLARFSAGPCNKVPTPSHGRAGRRAPPLFPLTAISQHSTTSAVLPSTDGRVVKQCAAPPPLILLLTEGSASLFRLVILVTTVLAQYTSLGRLKQWTWHFTEI